MSGRPSRLPEAGPAPDKPGVVVPLLRATAQPVDITEAGFVEQWRSVGRSLIGAAYQSDRFVFARIDLRQAFRKLADPTVQRIRDMAESRSRDTGGIGLGLAIARSTVQAHGGEFTLSNLPHGGLRAGVVLPL